MKEPSSAPTDAVPLRAAFAGMEENSHAYVPNTMCQESETLHIAIVLDSGCTIGACQQKFLWQNAVE